jgi:hypothetical protein
MRATIALILLVAAAAAADEPHGTVYDPWGGKTRTGAPAQSAPEPQPAAPTQYVPPPPPVEQPAAPPPPIVSPAEPTPRAPVSRTHPAIIATAIVVPFFAGIALVIGFNAPSR